MCYSTALLLFIALIPFQLFSQSRDSAIFNNKIAFTDSSMLNIDEMELPEAYITPYATYGQFKHAFATLNIINNPASQAQKNLSYIRIKPDLSLDANKRLNQLMLSKDNNNNSFLFFSTNENKGLWGLYTSIFK